MKTIYLAGGCLWGVQAFLKNVPGVIKTEAGRANGNTNHLDGPYDGYAECVKTTFNPDIITLHQLFDEFFDIIDPYSINQQGEDVGEKYRTGIYSDDEADILEAERYISNRHDSKRIVVETKVLTQYVRSADEHQDRLDKYPDDYCHIPKEKLEKYKE